MSQPKTGLSIGTLLKSINGSTPFLLMAIGVMFVISIIVIPLPAFLLDFLMVLNIITSLFILLLVLNARGATDFYIFPTLLLLFTVFRLAINVSSTRLILSQGANFQGQIVKTFAEFVTAGNFVIGIVIFLIVLVVQFVVTRGAGRGIEVRARFHMEGIPSKQMAIESDLASQIIDVEEAKQKKKKLDIESSFYGGMEGGAKFISGEVVASIIITLVNVIAGIVIGTVMNNEGFGDASDNYIRFAIGDGLVAGIPSLCLVIASGILVTKDDSKVTLPKNIQKQIFNNPILFYIVGGFLLALALVPGFPKIIFIALSALFIYVGYRLKKSQLAEKVKETEVEQKKEIAEEQKEMTSEDIFKQAQVEPLEIRVGASLIVHAQKGDLVNKVKKTRLELANELGVVIPSVRVRDDINLPDSQYTLCINGDVIDKFNILYGKLLAIKTLEVKEDVFTANETIDPVTKLPAYWINESDSIKAEKNNYLVADPSTIVAMHFIEMVKKNISSLVGRKETQKILDIIKEQNKALIDELDKNQISTSQVQKVFAELLSEGVSIRNVNMVLETVCDNTKFLPDNYHVIVDLIRAKSSKKISAMYSDNANCINAFTLSAHYSNEMTSKLRQMQNGSVQLDISAEEYKDLMDLVEKAVEEMKNKHLLPIMVVDFTLRRSLKERLQFSFSDLVILSYDEIDNDYRLNTILEI